MNTLLADEGWWSISQRERASRMFGPAIVSAFFDPLEPEVSDTRGIREEVIPLPGPSDGYSRVLFVGTTGAGKTTLLRHLIGSDHARDRFPSTSTAKTTISDIEVVTGKLPYEAIVTFFDEWRVHTNVLECVLDAGIAVWENEPDDRVAERLLHHRDQKFRLSYVLGRWNPQEIGIDQDEDDEWTIGGAVTEGEAGSDASHAGFSADERQSCQAFLEGVLSGIRAASREVIATLSAEFDDDVTNSTGADYDVYQDLFESELEKSAAFDDLVKDLMDQIRLRFDHVSEGTLQKRRSGWPQSWRFASDDRDSFIRQIRWFSSNQAESFGRLLTPLVDGIRIKGPFYPSGKLAQHRGKLVLLDGQGLGHTPDSSSSVSTHITGRFGEVDAIVLVDNAEQPVQAASLAAIRAVLSSGHQRKLALAMTHFENVTGDNLKTLKDRRAHVIASVRNGVSSFKDMGQIAVSSLLRRVDDRSFMLGYLNRSSDELPKGFVGEIDRLLDFFDNAILPAESVDLQPKYDMAGLAFAVQEAADDFNKRWAGLLGLGSGHGYRKEHWTRIKALTRRFALQRDIEYANLQPVADLVKRLEESILRFLEKPMDWSRRPKDDDEAEVVLSAIRQEVSAALHGLARRRIAAEHVPEWVEAYDRRGKGSTFVRARQVMNIYEAAAPIPGTVVDRIAADFLRDVRRIARDAIEANGGIIEAQ